MHDGKSDNRLTITVITTPEDIAKPCFQAMLSSVPNRCDVVVLLNRITGSDSQPTLSTDYCDPDKHIYVRIYEATYAEFDFSRLRNDAAALATTDWCMWLDSDDMIVYGDPVHVAEIAPPSVGAYECQLVGYQDIERRGVHYATSQLRMWRRSSGVQWIGKAHEILDTETITKNYLIAKADITIHHSGYIATADQQRKRLLRNVRGVCATVLDVWDRREDLREHYLRVLRDNIAAYHDLMFHHSDR